MRTKLAPTTVLAPLFLGSFLIARALLPPQMETYLGTLELVLPLVELCLLVLLAVRIRRVFGVYRDVRPTAVYATDALEESLRRGLGNTQAVGLLLTELTLIYYAFGGWLLRYRPIADTPAFTYHKKSGYGVLLGAMLFLSAVEIPLVHLLLQGWSPIAAWILTALTAYGILWLIGDYHAMRLHPIVLTADALYIRTGMRWRVAVPLAAVRRLRKASLAEASDKSIANLAAMGAPQYVLELDRPVTVRGLFGMRRTSNRLGLAIDDPATLIAALRTRGVEAPVN